MFSKRDIQYFDVATALAKVSTHHKAKLGAVIVQDREVVSTATNVAKSHPMQMKYNKLRNMEGDNHRHFIHAELNAIIKTTDKRKLKGASIYVSRICKSKEFGMARPCAACLQAIIDHGINHIFYTTDLGYAQEELKLVA